MTRITPTLHGNGCTFMTISHSVLLIVRNIAGKFEEKIKKKRILFSIIFFPEIVPSMIWCGKIW